MAVCGRCRVRWGVAVAWLVGAVASSALAQVQAPEDDAFGIQEVAVINQAIRQGWEDSEIKPSLPATDGEWCRRVYLDILGRIPSVDELESFVNNKDPRKKALLVHALLESDRYVEEYARNWTTVWTNILIGRSGGTERRSLTNREGMQKYLRDTFARNKPYDRMVFELVTARGATKPGVPNFNGATNFLAMKVNEEKASQATALTSKIFMGLQVQCTQCHNHPFNDWKQQKYWEMNAFFRQTQALRRFGAGTRDIDYVELVDADFAGEGGTPENAEIYYELRNGELAVAYPVFVDGTELQNTSGIVRPEDGGVSRRQELARLMVNSPYVARTVVNRYWGHFFGYGFTKPIDDMGPHNPASHPELLDYLAEQLRQRSYDLKQLITWITLSEAYSLSSRATSSNKDDDPDLGELPMFSHFYLRQLRAEELYESLLVATEAHKARGGYEAQEAAKREWLDQFVTAFGNDEGEEATTFNGTIPQALMMFNGELIKNATSVESGSFLAHIANSGMANSKKIEYLFQAGLARLPNKREITAANQLLALRRGDVVGALQDIWWAVLNSNEFILNH